MENNLELAKKYFRFELNKKIKYIEQMPGGFFDNVFLINNAYVLKLDKPFKEAFYDKTDHLLMLTMLGDFKYSEKVISFDPNKPYTIFKVVHQAVPYIDKIDSNQLISITRVLKKLHALEAPDYLPEFDPFTRIEYYKGQTKAHVDGRYEKKLLRLAQEIYDKRPRCICHNDIVQGNMLFGFNDSYLIDFEYSGLNIEEFDIASLLSENEISEEDKNLVLKEYYGSKLTQLKTKRINIMIALLNVLWFYWAHYMYKETSNEAYLTIIKNKEAKIELDRKTI